VIHTVIKTTTLSLLRTSSNQGSTSRQRDTLVKAKVRRYVYFALRATREVLQDSVTPWSRPRSGVKSTSHFEQPGKYFKTARHLGQGQGQALSLLRTSSNQGSTSRQHDTLVKAKDRNP